MLLTHGERRMNLLTPDNRHVLHHADIEAGKIVSTFAFQKDTVDIPIVEIASDYKAAQMEEHSQFLGLDQNRLCRWALRAGWTGRVWRLGGRFELRVGEERLARGLYARAHTTKSNHLSDGERCGWRRRVEEWVLVVEGVPAQ